MLKELCATLLICGRCFAQSGMSCITEMQIPRYTFIARSAEKTGTVEAVIRIGEGGKVASFLAKSPDPRLTEEVEFYLRQESSYSENCVGEEIPLLFTYRLVGGMRPDPFVVISFRPPNHFIITSQPRSPYIMHVPVPPKKSAAKQVEPPHR